MPVALMYQDRTFKQKTPGLTIKRKILGVWGQSPHEKLMFFDATVKSPKNAAKTMPTPQNREGKVLLTLASFFTNSLQYTCTDSYEEPNVLTACS